MSEYIKREAVIDEIESTTWYHISCQKNLVEGAACEADALYKATDIYNVIKSAPTADVVEVRRGKWIENSCYNICSVCEKYVHAWNDDGDLQEFAYCPHCGAKMDGGNNNA